VDPAFSAAIIMAEDFLDQQIRLREQGMWKLKPISKIVTGTGAVEVSAPGSAPPAFDRLKSTAPGGNAAADDKKKRMKGKKLYLKTPRWVRMPSRMPASVALPDDQQKQDLGLPNAAGFMLEYDESDDDDDDAAAGPGGAKNPIRIPSRPSLGRARTTAPRIDRLRAAGPGPVMNTSGMSIPAAAAAMGDDTLANTAGDDANGGMNGDPSGMQYNNNMAMNPYAQYPNMGMPQGVMGYPIAPYGAPAPMGGYAYLYPPLPLPAALGAAGANGNVNGNPNADGTGDGADGAHTGDGGAASQDPQQMTLQQQQQMQMQAAMAYQQLQQYHMQQLQQQQQRATDAFSTDNVDDADGQGPAPDTQAPPADDDVDWEAQDAAAAPAPAQPVHKSKPSGMVGPVVTPLAHHNRTGSTASTTGASAAAAASIGAGGGAGNAGGPRKPTMARAATVAPSKSTAAANAAAGPGKDKRSSVAEEKARARLNQFPVGSGSNASGVPAFAQVRMPPPINPSTGMADAVFLSPHSAGYPWSTGGNPSAPTGFAVGLQGAPEAIPAGQMVRDADTVSDLMDFEDAADGDADPRAVGLGRRKK